MWLIHQSTYPKIRPVSVWITSSQRYCLSSEHLHGCQKDLTAHCKDWLVLIELSEGVMVITACGAGEWHSGTGFALPYLPRSLWAICCLHVLTIVNCSLGTAFDCQRITYFLAFRSGVAASQAQITCWLLNQGRCTPDWGPTMLSAYCNHTGNNLCHSRIVVSHLFRVTSVRFLAVAGSYLPGKERKD